jgi:hypothetical protein
MFPAILRIQAGYFIRNYSKWVNHAMPHTVTVFRVRTFLPIRNAMTLSPVGLSTSA